ncbi:hypothetical protein NIIDNTM18_41400 [Mycolicibacterium litorale]|uniref:Uncharacterized protein n=1 Tax=Mycolicibacterium litorale TaxID=758802 RepID=A0A6S6P9S3_9MYCO|nr:hypothetical protein NIIDNTM18_41400 [Mycolicibacterium litorale]
MRPGNGRTDWIPPPDSDTGQPRTDNYFRPQRSPTAGAGAAINPINRA